VRERTRERVGFESIPKNSENRSWGLYPYSCQWEWARKVRLCTWPRPSLRNDRVHDVKSMNIHVMFVCM